MKLYFEDDYRQRFGIDTCEKRYCDSCYFNFWEENAVGGTAERKFIKVSTHALAQIMQEVYREKYEYVDESVLCEAIEKGTDKKGL